MPGLGEELASFRARSPEIELGRNLEDFISEVLPDFTHFTVLMFLVRQARGFVSAGDVAEITGDSKGTVRAVLELFKERGLVEVSGGFLSTKYAYRRDGPKAELVVRLLKLWEHSQTHQAVLCRLLVHPPGRK
jgi:DNA-binding transcriptional ArsR family regulator